MGQAINGSAAAMELAGIGVLLSGGILALVPAVRVRAEGFESVYRAYRQNLGRAILLGLEFLVAADIIRTVSIHSTLSSVSVLGLVVLIRTFLSLTLQLEIEGKFPWQKTEPSPSEEQPC